MLRTFLKSVVRSALRDRLISFVNVCGMAVGLAAGLLILLFVAKEYTRDAFHERTDRIFRVDVTTVYADRSTRWADTPFRLRDELKERFPSVEMAARFVPDFTVMRRGESVEYQPVHLVDPEFLRMFSFELEAGDPERVLRSPESAVVTHDFALRVFGSIDPVGQVLSFKIGDEFRDFTVTGVAAKIPATSSIQFQVLLPYAAGVPHVFSPESTDNWSGQVATFVLAREGADPASLEADLASIENVHGEALLRGRESVDFQLRPLKDIYFDEEASTRGITLSSSPTRANILFGIALLIVLIACVNFTTLSVARSARQNRGIGIRKVVGASRGMVATEYLTDALVKTGVAALLGLVLAELWSGKFSLLVDSPVELESLLTPTTALMFTALILVVALVSGAYPSFRLSAIQPINVLQGNAVVQGRSRLIRALVVLQFGITAVLLIGAVTFSRQITFMQNIDRGLEMERVMVVQPDFTSSSTAPELYRRLKAQTSSDITNVARSSGILGRSFGSFNVEVGGESRRATSISVSQEFMDMLGIETVAGESIDTRFAEGIVVNKAYADMVDLRPDALVGSTLLGDTHRVRGVTDNFYYSSVAREIQAFALMPLAEDHPGGYVLFEHTEGRRQEAMDLVRSTWREIAPDGPIEIYSLEEDLGGAGSGVTRWSRIVRYSTIFSVLIACMGLFGLSTLTTLQRSKEIGIRKILGARQTQLTGLLVRETALLALMGGLISIPVGWIVMQKMLSDYARRVEMDPLVLAGICLAIVVVAVATVSFQSIRVSMANPVESLRQE